MARDGGGPEASVAPMKGARASAFAFIDGFAVAALREWLGGRSVLVVDDNAVNRMVARKTLQGLGAKVELVESGEAALQRLLRPHAFALLLVDINMPPGIDG